MEKSSEESVAKRLRIQEREQNKLESPLKKPKLSKHLMELPNECMLNILRYLSNFDVLRNVAQVCKRFYVLSQDQHLIRKIKVDSETWVKIQEENNCEDLLRVLKRSLDLTFLSYDFGLNHGPPGKMFLKALSSMNHQFLKEVYIRAKDFIHEEILKYLEKCPNLKVLKLEFEPKIGNEVTQILVHKYLSWITSFKLRKLEEFYFGYEIDLNDSTDFKDFLEILAGNFPKMQRLCLNTPKYLAPNGTPANPHSLQMVEYAKICGEFASQNNINIEIWRNGFPHIAEHPPCSKRHYAVYPCNPN